MDQLVASEGDSGAFFDKTYIIQGMRDSVAILPTLTERLNAPAWADWPALYQQGHGALIDLVCALQRADQAG